MGGHGFDMGFGGSFMWIFWIALIVLVVWAASSAMGRGGSNQRPEKTALEILEERYAKGEIDREEFEQKRKDLNG